MTRARPDVANRMTKNKKKLNPPPPPKAREETAFAPWPRGLEMFGFPATMPVLPPTECVPSHEQSDGFYCLVPYCQRSAVARCLLPLREFVRAHRPRNQKIFEQTIPNPHTKKRCVEAPGGLSFPPQAKRGGRRTQGQEEQRSEKTLLPTTSARPPLKNSGPSNRPKPPTVGTPARGPRVGAFRFPAEPQQHRRPTNRVPAQEPSIE